jgi:two-component system sensor histidine kinase CpxA
MVRLVLKIFLAYWIAAGVVIAISDFEPHRHIHNPELTDALDGSLAINGHAILNAYQDGRCDELEKSLGNNHDGIYLASIDGLLLCGDPKVDDLKPLILSAYFKQKRMTNNYALFQMIAYPVKSERGATYIVLFKNSYSTALQVYGLLPGYTTIAISGVVTLFLAVLVALPVRRLRKAARAIASGKLGTRVDSSKLSLKLHGLKGGDDIDRLVTDFNHMAEKLQSLAEAQHLLLRDVSHELRSPLARMSVGLALARSGPPAAMPDHLNRIESETKRLNHLIGQILSLSYMETIQQANLVSSVSLSELVVDLLPDMQYEALQGSAGITTTIAERCSVQGDPEMLKAAIENIIRNAIRYTPTNGLIHIETRNEVAMDRTLAVIRISDNGPGIPEGEIKAVLEPFYRADKARHWRQDGFGIGLAIADRTAKLHTGNVSIWNKVDGGLVVEMSFPSADDSSRALHGAHKMYEMENY